jgi:hypothetical protein
LLVSFLGTPQIAVNCGDQALVLPFLDSIIGLPFREESGTFFIPTCLNINQIHSLETGLPVFAFNLHYGPQFTNPKIRNWDPVACYAVLKRIWQTKRQLPATPPKLESRRWGEVAAKVVDLVKAKGHGPGSRLLFQDHIHGPLSVELKPGEREVQFNELEFCKTQAPDRDWEKILSERDKQMNTAQTA